MADDILEVKDAIGLIHTSLVWKFTELGYVALTKLWCDNQERYFVQSTDLMLVEFTPAAPIVRYVNNFNLLLLTLNFSNSSTLFLYNFYNCSYF